MDTLQPRQALMIGFNKVLKSLRSIPDSENLDVFFINLTLPIQ